MGLLVLRGHLSSSGGLVDHPHPDEGQTAGRKMTPGSRKFNGENEHFDEEKCCISHSFTAEGGSLCLHTVETDADLHQ